MKTDKGVKELELVKSDKAGVTLAVLSYDDANRPGEFTSTFVSTEDMASVIVDGKETQLARPTEGVDIFEGKVAVPAKSGFTVEINKVAYGFAPYQRQRRRGQGREHDVGRTLLQQQYDRRFARLRLQDGRRADGRDGRRRQ